MNIEEELLKQLGPNYDRSAKPVVYFFDHAEEIESDGRPRFRNAIYISKRSRTANNNQDFHRKMLEEDKAEFPDEWAYYLKVKENLKKPRIGLLPGIDEATQHEMKAIGIYNLEQLVAQDEFGEWKATERRILDASQIREQRRAPVQSNDNQRTIGILEGSRPRTQETIRETWNQENQEKGYQEKSVEEENVTFNFEMKVA